MTEQKLLTNQQIEKILESYQQERKSRPLGLCKGEFITPDDFNESLSDEILALFEG